VTLVNTPTRYNFGDNFVPPQCSAFTEPKEGCLELQMQGLHPDLLEVEDKREDFRQMFRDVYNALTGRLKLQLYLSMHYI